uniref:EOG090X027A n=1 Tax=Daphnia similis TaxID=35528 RepID=A0A4Y7LRJ9_9CRUS|nr:EOG090X027A [Daphnia similis]SVE70913.1 EOG090X027A [Daphnia similis]SVE71544.1 EOG090X027A [Daphnia similis]SVE72177.1 EOG090X027A [Daphnia similis]
MSTRKRSTSGSKKQLKEKIVQIYEAFFRGEDQASGNSNFWDEFFLLKPKVGVIEAELVKLNCEQLGLIKENLNTLFSKCVFMLGHEHQMRVAHSLQTLCALIKASFVRSSVDVNCDIIELLIGAEAAEMQMQLLIEHCSDILTSECPVPIKALCLKMMVLTCTGNDNIAQNPFYEYFTQHSVFESLVHILCQTQGRLELGQDAVVVVTLMACYRKTGSANPYMVKLSMLDDELALTAYAQVVMASLGEFNERYVQSRQAEPQSSWLSSLTSMVGSMFVSDEAEIRIGQVKANDAGLLALYQAVHLNRHFVGIIAQSLADVNPPTTTVEQNETAEEANQSDITNTNNTVGGDKTNVTSPPTIDVAMPTSNLMATYLEYCSIIMQDTRSEAAYHSTKLCFLILTCVSEDEYANSLMHDPGLTFRVPLHRLPMRHRKSLTDKTPPFRPLVCGLLDLIIEFILSHLMKKFPHELYELALGVVLRVLCHQKRCRLRLSLCPWKELWAALIALLKFLHSSDSALIRKFDLFALATQAVNILNLFVTFGDTFLPSPQSYDDLYYEIIRMHHVFDNLHAMALRYSTGENEFRESAVRLSAALINVRAIGQHFKPKVEMWMESQKLSTPTQDQILEVVRSHYDSLTLKLHESLDAYERYAERPPVAAFLSSILRSVVSVIRSTTDPSSIDAHRMLLESTAPTTPTSPSAPN